MTKEQIYDHYDELKRTIDELKNNSLVIVQLRKEFNKHIEDLQRMLDEFEFGRATACEDDGRRFKVVVDGVTYYADEPKVKTIHEKTGEVVIGGFYRDGYL